MQAVLEKTYRLSQACLPLCTRRVPDYWEGVAGGNGPLRFSLACLGFSFLFRGVQRGYFSFWRESSRYPETCDISELLVNYPAPIYR
jgi:hypothetical protein